MSRPRKPFGAVHPGRLPATMVKVLAAEMSDPARLRRGKEYAKDGSVIDIVIEPGVVTCEVLGSRSTPYVASVEVRAGNGMPLRRDIRCTCTCPDDDNWDGHACKHVVAALFTLSNELLLEPELLDVWRGNAAGAFERRDVTQSDSSGRSTTTDESPSGGTRRHLTLVRDLDDDTSTNRPGRQAEPSRPFEDPLREVLRFPPGSTLPDIPLIPRAELPRPRDRELAGVLNDALLNVRVDWD